MYRWWYFKLRRCDDDPMIGLLRAVDRKLDLILTNQEHDMSVETMNELRAALTRNTSAKDSIKALLANIIQRLKDAEDDPVEVRAIIAEFDTNSTELASAAVANTPAA